MVYGRLGDDDEFVEPSYVTLAADDLSAPRPLLRLGGTGPARARSATPSGFSPSHPLLASRAELGLVTYPDAPAGMTNRRPEVGRG